MTTAFLTHEDYHLHSLPGHPEHAERLQRVLEVLAKHGMIDKLLSITPKPAAAEQLALIHTPDYVALIERAAQQGGGMLDPDTYLLPVSYEVARLAAGGVLDAVDAVMSGQADNAIALVRPPGHHALPNRGMGFCIFNNAAIAARHAQQAHGIERVMIVDYDVHHGNGTEVAFYDDPSVLYISTHQYPFYPGSGALRDIGRGDGLGTTVNMPLSAGVGNEGFKALYERVLWPAARRFKPDVIIVSAGFDAHWDDPLAMLELDLGGYVHITRELIQMAREMCRGRIIVTLEGGYNLKALSYGILNVGYALLGEDTVEDPLGPSGGYEPSVARLIDELLALHQLG
jgi:acetoin utilization deacetylase AcuC-like enzyme